MTLGRFVHTSDLHLGSPFSGTDSSAPHVAEALRQATHQALESIVDLCIRENVDGLLVAGDVFDVPSLRAEFEFQKALQRLHDAGIRSFVCHGNHDALDMWRAGLHLPPSCHRFGSEPSSVPLRPERPDDIVITGVSFPTRDVRRNLAAQFERPTSARFAVGLLHANVTLGDFGQDAYAACRVEDLVPQGFGYWALGHSHDRKVHQVAGVTISYSGAPQGLNRKQSGPRGVNLVTVSDAGEVSVEFRETARVRWENASIDLARYESHQEMVDTLRVKVMEFRQRADGQRIICDFVLDGTTQLHHSLHRSNFVRDLRDELNREFGESDPWTWCTSIAVKTTPPFNRNERRQAGDFVGSMLRLVDRASSEERVLESLKAGSDELLLDDRFRDLLGSLTSDEWKAVLADAETKCIDGLEESK